MNTFINNKLVRLSVLAVTFLLSAPGLFAGIQTTVGHFVAGQESPGFTFTNVPPPSRNDAATTAKFTVLSGEVDRNGGGLEKLHDGKIPAEADEPAENCFFAAGAEGGRIQLDLGQTRELAQVNTYSWHPTTRGPQVYKLYASDGTAKGFIALPESQADLETGGWKLIARVDARPKAGDAGGQYGVSIADSTGVIGTYRYLLFDLAPTETDDAFGNTFFSEIDVVERNTFAEPVASAAVETMIIKSADGYCEIAIDTTKAPQLKEWAEQKLAPVLAEWYPKIAAMMPSDGFSAPKKFSVVIKPSGGVASTSGTRITANPAWLSGELQGEAVGALVHEVVHVLQQYYGGWRNKPGKNPPPNWLVEGIPDYIRFFKYEPQSHGADLVWLQGRRNTKLKYDGLYRISANFLDYVVGQYDPDQNLIRKVNAACRQGTYTDALWQELTGQSLAELNEQWTAAVQKQLAK